jgi:cysteinyl-tRNA synthetase
VIRRLLLIEAGDHTSPLTLTSELDSEGRARFPQLEIASEAVTHLYVSKRRLLSLPAVRISEVEWKAPAEIVGLRARLLGMLGPDDLQTPLALAEVGRFLGAVNELTDKALRKQGSIARSHRTDALRGFDTIAELLTLGVEQPRAYLDRGRDRQAAARGISKPVVESKIRERAEARESKDFARADALRAELKALGVELLESSSSTEWTVD